MNINFFKVSKFLLYVAPFAVVVVTPSTLFPFIVGKYTFFKVVIELALIAFVLGIGFSHNFKLPAISYKLFKNPLVIAVTLFVAIFTLSGFTGVNPSASFWSNFERGEGSFLMLHFYVFFILLSLLFEKENDWKLIFKLSLFAGVLMILYGVGGILKIPGFFGNSLCQRFAGSLGNAAYVGTYSIFAIFYASYLAATGNWLQKRWLKLWLPLLIFMAVLFFAALLMSQTRGALLGLGTGLILALVYLFFTMPSKKMRVAALGTAILLVAIGSLGIYFRQSIDLLPFCEGGGNRILDVSLGGETIGTRLVLWQQAIQAFKERPILGWGPENFSIAFEKYYNPVHKVWFDRAHNIFFDYLVFSGILGLLSFLGIFVVFYWNFFTSKTQVNAGERIDSRGYQNKKQADQLLITNYQLLLTRALLFGLPIAYLVQGLVLFDVLPIYINSFLFLAFATYKLKT